MATRKFITYDGMQAYSDALAAKLKTKFAAKQDSLTADQLTAVNSGITAAKVSTYDGYAAQIAAKQDALTVDTALDSTSTNPVENKAIKAAVDAKQDALTASQLAAVDSGVTADKVAAYDGYATEIAAKQDALTEAQLAAINSGISSADLTSIEADVAANKSAIETLNGTGEGSVSKAVTDGIAQVVADAPESLDTLKEISDWISTHEDSAAAMNSAIQTNATNIAANTTAIAAKQDKLTAGDGITISDANVISSTVGADVTTLETRVAANETAIAGKQDSLTTDQLAAVNSGITADKVSTYDGYAAQIAAKQDALTSDDATFTSGVMSINAATSTEVTTIVDGMDF